MKDKLPKREQRKNVCTSWKVAMNNFGKISLALQACATITILTNNESKGKLKFQIF